MSTPKYREKFEHAFQNKYFISHVKSRLENIRKTLLTENND